MRENAHSRNDERGNLFSLKSARRRYEVNGGSTLYLPYSTLPYLGLKEEGFRYLFFYIIYTRPLTGARVMMSSASGGASASGGLRVLFELSEAHHGPGAVVFAWNAAGTLLCTSGSNGSWRWCDGARAQLASFSSVIALKSARARVVVAFGLRAWSARARVTARSEGRARMGFGAPSGARLNGSERLQPRLPRFAASDACPAARSFEAESSVRAWWNGRDFEKSLRRARRGCSSARRPAAPRSRASERRELLSAALSRSVAPVVVSAYILPDDTLIIG